MRKDATTHKRVKSQGMRYLDGDDVYMFLIAFVSFCTAITLPGETTGMSGGGQ